METEPSESQVPVVNLLTSHLNHEKKKYAQKVEAVEREKEAIFASLGEKCTTLSKRLELSREMHASKTCVMEAEVQKLRHQAEQSAAENSRLRAILDSFIKTGTPGQAQQLEAAMSQPTGLLLGAPQPSLQDSKARAQSEDVQALRLECKHLRAQLDHQRKATHSWKFYHDQEKREKQEMKQVIKQWQRFIDSKTSKHASIQRPPDMPAFDPPATGMTVEQNRCTLPYSEAHKSLDSEADGSVKLCRDTKSPCGVTPELIQEQSDEEHNTPGAAPLVVESENGPVKQPAMLRQTAISTQSTQGEEQEQPHQQQQRHFEATKAVPRSPVSAAIAAEQHDNDDVQIVSERPVKRRRVSPGKQNQGLVKDANLSLAPASGGAGIHVKKELDSDSQILPIRLQLAPVDSMDLDEVSGDVVTPSRRRHLQRIWSNGGRPFPAFSSQNVRMDRPAEGQRGSSVPAEDIDADPPSDAADTATIPPEMQTFDGDLAGLKKAKSRERKDTLKSFAKHSDKGDDQSTTPGSLNPTRTTLPSTSPPARQRTGRLPLTSKDLALKVMDLAEDGENGGSADGPSKPSKSRDRTLASTPRIANLLQSAALPPRTLLQEPIKTPCTTKPKKRPISPHAPSVTEYFRRPLSSQATPTAKSTTAKQKRAPLRSLSPSALVLDDFRINPNFNDHTRHAFTETVRGNARQHLPGCTDPSCPRCGPNLFDKILAIGGALKGPTSRTLFPDESQDALSSQDAEEARLLERELGPSWRERAHKMTREERDDALRRARVQEMADRTGKHRQQWVRARSPPNFWRTDMPSTQEMAAAKAEAAREESRQVRERWSEAMRGGKWMFRDEA